VKAHLKKVANVLAILIVLPLAGMFHLSARLMTKDRVFPGFSQLISLVPGVSGVYLRHSFYRLILDRCDRDACICFGTVFSHPEVTVGKAVYIGVGSMVGNVDLQDDVLLGSHVSIINGNRQHGIDRLDIPVREQPGEYPRITIGQDTWIGDRAVVMANVGKHCVVGAGSVVTKPLDDYAIAAGNPARVIGSRSDAMENSEIGLSELVSSSH
jgi:acetyltransferase-like isoleucine patch superfamily enzyme